MKYQLICLSFDGDYQIEGKGFESIRAAWDRADDMGSRWFFYPFHFVMSESGKTVIDAPEPLRHLIGWRLKRLIKHFKETAARPDLKNADAEMFAYSL